MGTFFNKMDKKRKINNTDKRERAVSRVLLDTALSGFRGIGSLFVGTVFEVLGDLELVRLLRHLVLKRFGFLE